MGNEPSEKPRRGRTTFVGMIASLLLIGGAWWAYKRVTNRHSRRDLAEVISEDETRRQNRVIKVVPLDDASEHYSVVAVPCDLEVLERIISRSLFAKYGVQSIACAGGTAELTEPWE